MKDVEDALHRRMRKLDQPSIAETHAEAPSTSRDRDARPSRRTREATSMRRRRAATCDLPTGRQGIMTQEDIDATKAPLLDHLIELRSRLIKALLAFGIAFIFCFFFAKQIYNVLVWPFTWVAGVGNSKFIYTALLEYFITQLKLAMFGAAFISFPVIATQIYMFVAPGLYRNERQAFLPYLIATPVFFASARRWSISSCCRCW